MKEIRQMFWMFWIITVPLLVFLTVEELVFWGWEFFFCQVPESLVLPLTAFSWIVAIIPLGMEYKKGESKNPGEKMGFLGMSAWFGAAGIGGCLFLNGLLRLLPLPDEGYYQASQVLYKPGLPVQLASMGVIIPMGEELVFRGLGYGRIRRELSFPTAAILSAVYFGLYHGTVLQGLYAFLFGLLLAGIYEWGGGLRGCFLFHGGANMTSVILQETGQNVTGAFLGESRGNEKAWLMLMMLTGFGLMSWCFFKILQCNKIRRDGKRT